LVDIDFLIIVIIGEACLQSFPSLHDLSCEMHLFSKGKGAIEIVEA